MYTVLGVSSRTTNDGKIYNRVHLGVPIPQKSGTGFYGFKTALCNASALPSYGDNIIAELTECRSQNGGTYLRLGDYTIAPNAPIGTTL